MFDKTIALRYFVFLFAWYASPINTVSISLSNPKKNWELFFNRIIPVCKVDTFVESGTYLGHTAEQAARTFAHVHTIELYHEFYARAAEYLKDYTNTVVYHGDTVKVFPDLLPKLVKQNRKPLFWLDGHFMTCMSNNDTDDSPESFLEGDFTPVLKEIEFIKQFQLRHSVILVDDVRLFGTVLDESRLEKAGNKHYPLLTTTRHALKDAGYESVVLGDMLFAYNKEIDITFSPIIQACTISRTFDGSNYSIDDVLQAEQLIAETEGEEYEALTELYIDFSKPWRGWYNKSPHYNLWYGLLLQHKGAHEEACKQFEEVLSLGYNHWRLQWYLAQSLLALNDVNQAKELLLEIPKIQPGFQPALDLLYDIFDHNIKAEYKKETQKYVIGSWPGGLGVCLHSVLNHLARCEKEDLTPVIHWGAKSLYHKPEGFNGSTNVWEYYFEPVSDLKYQRGDPVHVYMPSVWSKFSYNLMNQASRDHGYQLIKKFIKVKPSIQKKIDDFYHENISGKHTIAIHIRGTDKIKEQKKVDPQKIISEALSHAKEDTQFFLATDEQKLLDKMIALLPERKVLYYDCYRSQDGKPLHVKNRRPSFAQVGEDVLIEMSLMAKCDLLVHTLSNVSNFPLYLNPKLPDIVFKAYYKDTLL